jgi:uncharacterized Ntn-hydrolase superfamily protein
MLRTARAYTQPEIQVWKVNLHAMPARISSCTLAIASCEKHIAELQETHNTLIQNEISPVEITLSALTSQINVLTLPKEISSLSVQIEYHATELAKVQPQLETAKKILAPINDRITKLNAAIIVITTTNELAQKEQELTYKSKTIRSLEAEIYSLKRRIDSLHSTLSSKKSSLSSLKTADLFDTVSHISSSGHHHHTHRHGYSSVLHNVNDVARTLSISNLESEIRSLNNEDNRLERDLSGHKTYLNLARNEERQIENIISNLRRTLNENNRIVGNFAHPNSLVETEALLSNEQSIIVQPERTYQQLKIQNDHHFQTHVTLRSQRSKKSNLFENSKLTAGHFKDNTDLNHLNQMRIDQNEILSGLNKQRSNLEYLINDEERSLRIQESELLKMQQQHSELQANHFLIALQNNPRSLVQPLYQTLLKNLNDYDFTHPVGQNLAVRGSLNDMRAHANAIANSVDDIQLEGDEVYRRQYYQLSGLIFTNKQKANLSADFSALLTSTLGVETVDPQEAYLAYQQMHLNSMTDVDMMNLDSADYEKAYQQFNKLLGNITKEDSRELRDFYTLGKNLLTAINSERSAALSKHDQNFDIKYHTSLINAAASVLVSPGEISYRTNLARLASHNAHGKPSLGKKIWGAIMMFIGAAGIAASLGIGLLSVGMLSPYVLVGMGAGATLFAGGLALCISGRRKGIDKALVNFQEQSNKPNLGTSLFKPATQHEAYYEPPTAPLLSK